MFKLFRLKFGIIHLFQLINNSFKVGVDIFEAVEIEIGFVNIYHLVEHIFWRVMEVLKSILSKASC